MKFLFLILCGFAPHAFCLNPHAIVQSRNYSEEIALVLNNTEVYIIELIGEIFLPPKIKISSTNADESAPLMIMVRQPKQVLSWQIPLVVTTEMGNILFFQTSRILCYDDAHHLENPIVTVSTSSKDDLELRMIVEPVTEFSIDPGEKYTTLISPSEPSYFFYNFSTNETHSQKNSNFDMVILEAQSDDSVCMTISIQNASCPVMDLNSDITYAGFYETITTKGGITIPKDKFPFGFYIVFVAAGDDNDCTGEGLSVTNRTKTLTFSVKPSISYADYWYAVIATLCCVGAFYLMFGLSFFYCSRRSYRPRAMEYVEDSPQTSVPCSPVEEDGDNISFDETEYDTVIDVHSDREIFLNKPVIFLSDLARKDPRILQRKSYLYLYNVLTVAIFYGLPVVQLVITYQRVLNKTGQQDLCYYNFLCAHPLGFLSDFNHLFSNVGYVLLGVLFLGITSRREVTHCDLQFDQQYGIPQHYGMFYAMGVALIMEGVLSGCYHICPNHTNFQFDSSFMYVVAVLCMVKLYQNRHPDINATAYATFGVLAVAILLSMIGILEGNIYFWSFFTVVHLLTCLFLTLQIYYMGYWKLDTGTFVRVYRSCTLECLTGPMNALRPKYKERMVLLVIGNLFNWGLAFAGIYFHLKDFGLYLLALFMANTLLYFTFYIIMKLLHRERVNKLPLLFLLFSVLCAVSSMYFFLMKSISWALTPAQSRHFNKECAFLRFYDYHDIWHFLSAVGMFFTFMVLLTLDDDLSHTHRSKIHVF